MAPCDSLPLLLRLEVGRGKFERQRRLAAHLTSHPTLPATLHPGQPLRPKTRAWPFRPDQALSGEEWRRDSFQDLVNELVIEESYCRGPH